MVAPAVLRSCWLPDRRWRGARAPREAKAGEKVVVAAAEGEGGGGGVLHCTHMCTHFCAAESGGVVGRTLRT